MADEISRNTVHELNNLFQVILGSLEVIKRSGGDAPVETVETALRATREAAVLAQRLLAALKPPGEGDREGRSNSG